MFQAGSRLAAAALLVATLSASPALAAKQATATASATVVKPLTVTASAQMSFGKLQYNGNGPASSYVLLPSQPGVARSSPEVQLLPNGNETPAIRTIVGAAGRVYRVTLPTSTVSTPDGLTVNAFTIWSANGGNISGTRLGQLNASGTDTIRIGATMTVPKGTKNAVFTANPTILISYE